jgi:hypothetical protein
MLAAILTVDHWLFTDITGTILVLVLAFIMVFHPDWIDRLIRREEERSKNWRTHPGQWS